MEQKPVIQQYLSRREASELLHVHPRTLDRWREKKMIAYYKLGGRFLYDKNDVLAMLKKEN